MSSPRSLSSSTIDLIVLARPRGHTSRASGVSTTMRSRTPSVATSRPEWPTTTTPGVDEQHRSVLRLGQDHVAARSAAPTRRSAQHLAQRVEVADVGPAEVARHGGDQPDVGRALHHARGRPRSSAACGHTSPSTASCSRCPPGRRDRVRPRAGPAAGGAARRGTRRPARRTCSRSRGSARGHVFARHLGATASP